MIRRGLSIRRAAEALKIHHSTISRWRAENDGFASAVATAEAQFVEDQLTAIRGAAVKGSWQAAAWMLERRFPAEFSQPQIQLTQTNLKTLAPAPSEEDLAKALLSPALRQHLQAMLDNTTIVEADFILESGGANSCGGVSTS